MERWNYFDTSGVRHNGCLLRVRHTQVIPQFLRNKMFVYTALLDTTCKQCIAHEAPVLILCSSVIFRLVELEMSFKRFNKWTACQVGAQLGNVNNRFGEFTKFYNDYERTGANRLNFTVVFCTLQITCCTRKVKQQKCIYSLGVCVCVCVCACKRECARVCVCLCLHTGNIIILTHAHTHTHTHTHVNKQTNKHTHTHTHTHVNKQTQTHKHTQTNTHTHTHTRK